ncbi:MAG: MltA domain-containing protein [Zoogloeaceae bacterium]|jgi:membrane-bound lytic murein transglycosylase A|nr:MltA domain-containing protein [Zoogloeaceae bacterium]
MQKSQSFCKNFFIILCSLSLAACALPWREKTPEAPSTATPSAAQANACPAVTEAMTCPVCPACSASLPPTPAETRGEASPPPPRLEAATWDDLPGWREDSLAAAWQAFQTSCRGMADKAHGATWREVCRRARTLKGDEAGARRFFEENFTPYAIIEADGRVNGLVTGYYEPLIRGSRQRDARNQTPVLGVPADMLTIELGDLFPELQHKRVRGRIEGNKVVPYWSRAEIEAQAHDVSGRVPGRVLFWVEDPIEFFFLQTQGSGRVELPDGSLARIGYADQNGHPFHSIGRVLIERGELKPEEASMQGIQAWARAHPGELRALLDKNPSYVFFRELPDSSPDVGPIGALGVPLTPERSIAVDARYVPLGAPVWLATTRPNSNAPLNRLMLAQDTGGAIKGGVRADFFWGFGHEAGQRAGRMKQRGRMWVLLPEAASP